MKKPVLVIVVLFAAVLLMMYGFKSPSAKSSGETAEGINWTVASTPQAEIEATGKPVYLFVSTDWCTFCKKMKSQTFTDPKVQELLNDLFVAITINPEKPGNVAFTGKEMSYSDLARQLGVTGYPANYFFGPDGKLIGGQPGYIDAKAFADIAEYIGDGHYKDINFNEFMKLPADKRR